jgi:hypothetical protein
MGGSLLQSMQLFSDISDHGSAPRLALEDRSAVMTALNGLLLQRVKLSNDIARVRKVLKQLAQEGNSGRLGKASDGSRSARASSSQTLQWGPIPRGGPDSTSANGKRTRPRRSNLDRACRIALMEANKPEPVEALYDRIERRGAISIAGYKHPLRAIVIAMGVLVKRGEAVLLFESGYRRWRWADGARTLEPTNSSPLSPLT